MCMGEAAPRCTMRGEGWVQGVGELSVMGGTINKVGLYMRD